MNAYWNEYRDYLERRHLNYVITVQGIFKIDEKFCTIYVGLNETIDVKIHYNYLGMESKPMLDKEGSIGIISFKTDEEGILFVRKPICLEKIEVEEITMRVERAITMIEETAIVFLGK